MRYGKVSFSKVRQRRLPSGKGGEHMVRYEKVNIVRHEKVDIVGHEKVDIAGHEKVR